MPLETKPAAEVLRGLQLKDLGPTGKEIPVEVICLIKYFDEDGQEGWALRASQGISTVETIGALRVILRRQEIQFDQNWRTEADDDDDA